MPDLRAYLNDHPNKDDPFAPLLLSVETGKPLSYGAFYSRIVELSSKILGRRIHPHQFRHTRATQDSRFFTDRELMKLNGWRKPETVSVYSHLSMKDVEDKDLVLHGLKSKEEILRPIVEVIKCAHCQEENAPIAMYCHKCGSVLSKQSTHETVQEEVRRILKEEYPQLVKELTKET